MKNKRFQRTIENFICNNCAHQVIGNGYTNHCPICLWSKHVDINPGDRLSDCQGMMEPVGVIYLSGHYLIEQRCNKCKVVKKIKADKNDDQNEIIKLSILV